MMELRIHVREFHYIAYISYLFFNSLQMGPTLRVLETALPEFVAKYVLFKVLFKNFKHWNI
jgi:hypothetical protein